ncbi:MAG TPA: hypothetical protein VHG69_09295 [Thermoleophilaceae bacterium]|nr:hypothetical protein [Thermoleophilaceae bacterium]
MPPSGELADALARLDEITRRLRRECPWDREQDERSIVPHTVEEAYELADAANAGDELVRLLDRVRDDRALVLLAVPGALAAQAAGQLVEAGDGGGGVGLWHRPNPR